MKLTLNKAEALVDDDGMFSDKAMQLLTDYANRWMAGSRNLEMERMYPELVGSFYDIRADSDYALRWADAPVEKSLDAHLQDAGLLPRFVLSS